MALAGAALVGGGYMMMNSGSVEAPKKEAPKKEAPKVEAPKKEVKSEIAGWVTPEFSVPTDPFKFPTPDYPPEGLTANVLTLPHFIRLGCGSSEYICDERGANFTSTVVPDACPDLKDHNNFMTDCLKDNSTMYKGLKNRKTALGVTLGHCIKTGIDNKGHPHIKTCGLVAGDEESYTVFAPLFDHVIDKRHNGFKPWMKHPTDMNPENLSKRQLDPTGKYIMTTRCRTGRSVRGFKLPPVNSFEERREIERLVVEGLMKLDGDLKGDYYPLHGSRSYAPKPTGMSEEYAEELR